jgi:two-component system alkaline phosphatase synthesis response regulator PhoP
MLCAVTSQAPHEELRAGALHVVPDAYTAYANGQVIPLTPRELDLLVVLMQRRDRVLPREVLYRLCWGHEMAPADRAVDVYVRKLRAKLEHALPDWRFIHTHYRLGYRFSPTPVEASEGDAVTVNDETRSVL